MILDKIVEQKRIQLESDKKELPLETIKYMIKNLSTYPVRSFKQALIRENDIAIIGEIKKASPSKGIIREKFNPCKLANCYEKAGVQALSVLTEKNFFQGKDEYLSDIRRISSIPILRKDFIIDPWQIYQSRVLGADAILLIVGILSQEELVKFHIIAEMLGMDCLVEVHDQKELERALEANVEIIGINNRNLKDFTVSLKTTEKLMEYIPEGKIVVGESGIQSPQDIDYMKSLGVNALLIGESFMRSEDIGAKLQELKGLVV